MKRIEIILNEAVEADLMTAFASDKAVPMFTKIPVAYGQGYSVPKQGDEIWPQQNIIIVVYCDEEQVKVITDIVKKLREQYPDDGIALFATDAVNLL